jgi:protein gp37
MKRSSIAWTDYSGNVANFILRGKHDCECSPACDNCYMRRLDERFGGHLLPEVTTCYPDKLDKLARMRFPQDGNKRGPHSKPMVFVVDGGDIFHENVPDEFIDAAFSVMMQRQDVVWQVLTKRAKRMRDTFLRYQQMNEPYAKANGWPHPIRHIWLGVTCENDANRWRVDLLRETPAAVRFVSCEPLLGAIGNVRLEGINWTIVGGESGPNARPMHLDWARSLRDQCKAAGVAYFFKQSGGPRPGMGETLDGETYHEWPEVGA